MKYWLLIGLVCPCFFSCGLQKTKSGTVIEEETPGGMKREVKPDELNGLDAYERGIKGESRYSGGVKTSWGFGE